MEYQELAGEQESQREIWRQARRHISDYEEKLRELEFDLRHEQDRLKTAQDQQTVLKQECEAVERTRLGHISKCNELNAELVRLHKESDRLSKEAPQYAQQLTLVNADLAKLVEHSAQEREGMQHHLAEQQQVLDKYRDFTQGGGCGEGGPPASADQSAAG